MADSEQVACLALHLSGKFLTARTERQRSVAGNYLHLARVLLGQGSAQTLTRAEKLLNEWGTENLLLMCDRDYPELLEQSEYAPFALFLKGNRRLLQSQKVAIVGTREPSAAGRRAAQIAAAYFTERGATIVSGIARGVDAIAHHAALASGGNTIAVLPNGFMHMYPLENRDLYALAGESASLLFMSEYAPDTRPQRHHFVRRNRLIAALAPLTAIIEAGEKSGAMITAACALKEGREVAAFADDSLLQNAGGRRLIAEGALDLSALLNGGYNQTKFAEPALRSCDPSPYNAE